MKINVHAVAEFSLTMDKETVADLIECSRRHYDYTCRGASAETPDGRYKRDSLHGFLLLWRNILNNGFTDEVTASWQQLDLLLKICEQGRTERLGHFTIEVMRALNWAKENIYPLGKDDVTAEFRNPESNA